MSSMDPHFFSRWLLFSEAARALAQPWCTAFAIVVSRWAVHFDCAVSSVVLLTEGRLLHAHFERPFHVKVYVVARTAETLNATAAQAGAVPIQGDVSDAKEVERIYKRVRRLARWPGVT